MAESLLSKSHNFCWALSQNRQTSRGAYSKDTRTCTRAIALYVFVENIVSFIGLFCKRDL